MNRALAAATLAACLAATAVLAAATASAGTDTTRNAPPCMPKVTKIKGHQAAVNCGPATVTLHVGGKTYTFRHGFCQQSASAGSALQLDLGTVVLGAAGNAGLPDFSMLIAHNHRIASVFHADYGGKRLLGDSLIDVKGNVPSKGTFTSRATTGARFSGSWNCHGVVWRG